MINDGKKYTRNDILQITAEALHIMEFSYKGVAVPVVIQNKNIISNAEITADVQEEQRNDIPVINRNCLSYKKPRHKRKKRRFWHKLLGC